MITTLDEVLTYAGKLNSATPDERALFAFLRNAAERKVKQYLRCSVEQATFVEILPGQRQEYDEDADFVGYERVGTSAVGYSGFDAGQVLALKETPVRSVQAVYLTHTQGGGGFPSGTLLDPSLYYLDEEEPGLSRSGFLVYPYGAWPTTPRSVKVHYTAGFTQPEMSIEDGRFPEFKLAVCMTAVRAFRTSQAGHDQQMGFSGVGTISAEKLDGVSFSYDPTSARMLTGQVVVELTPEVQGMLQEWVNYTDSIGFMG